MGKKSNLKQRVITGILFGIVMIFGVWFHRYSYLALIILLVGLALWEFWNLFITDFQTEKILWLMFSLMVLVSGLFFPDKISLLPIWVGVFGLFLFTLFQKGGLPFERFGYYVLGNAYVMIPFFLLLNSTWTQAAHNWQIPLLLLSLIWSNDSGAYFTGKYLGKRKLFERVSPNKTWEGFLGGVFFALLTLFLWNTLSGQHFSYFLAIIVGSFGTLGDLVQSMLKRSIHIKDSGSILPGHGGILDRFDGFIFILPFALFFIKYFN